MRSIRVSSDDLERRDASSLVFPAELTSCSPERQYIVFRFHLLSATSKPFCSLSTRLAHPARLGMFLQKRAI